MYSTHFRNRLIFECVDQFLIECIHCIADVHLMYGWQKAQNELEQQMKGNRVNEHLSSNVW